MSNQNSGLTQDDFRNLLSTPQVNREPQENISFLEQKRNGAIPKTPRYSHLQQNSAKSSEFVEPKPRKPKLHKPKNADKSTGSESKYRDRAYERRLGINSDYQQADKIMETLQNSIQDNNPLISDTTASNIVNPSNSTPNEQDSARLKSALHYEQSKYLGGDAEHTHLVKGLDYLLLAKMKQKIINKVDQPLPEDSISSLKESNLDHNANNIDFDSTQSIDNQLDKVADEFIHTQNFKPIEINSIDDYTKRDQDNSNNSEVSSADLLLEYAPITKFGKSLSFSLSRINKRFQVCENLRYSLNTKSETITKLCDRVTKSEVFNPLQIYHVFETKDDILLDQIDINTYKTKQLFNEIPKTVFRNQSEMKELKKLRNFNFNSSDKTNPLFSDPDSYLESDNIVITKVANAIAIATNKKIAKKILLKQLPSNSNKSQTSNLSLKQPKDFETSLELQNKDSSSYPNKTSLSLDQHNTQMISPSVNNISNDTQNSLNCDHVNSADHDEDIFADAGTDYIVEIEPKPQPDLTNKHDFVALTSDFEPHTHDEDFYQKNNLNFSVAQNKLISNENNFNSTKYDDEGVTGPYPNTFNELDDDEGLGDDEGVTGPYPNTFNELDDDEGVTGPYPNTFNELNDDQVNYNITKKDNSRHVAEDFPNNFGNNDSIENNIENFTKVANNHNPEANIFYNNGKQNINELLNSNNICTSNDALHERKIQKEIFGQNDKKSNKIDIKRDINRNSSNAAIDSRLDIGNMNIDIEADDYYANDIGLLSDAYSEDEEIQELTAMDAGSTNKFKKSQLTRYDFDSLEEWAAYKDNIVQLPKAAFQFGIKSKDAARAYSKNKATQKISKRKINSLLYNDTNVDKYDNNSELNSENASYEKAPKLHKLKEIKNQEKFDKSWQETKRFMLEKYGDGYFKE
ncbi:hypothetical protein BB561_003067 [Smittium simulii]|uniref:RED-like N-terminal domain-containing protein n=1 Tax=Smittium simulii TaxID=133385 RepID=A0A2T9YN37_9FUNG|nr:hypothetical protein BB561_003067 [Smittium simulii]